MADVVIDDNGNTIAISNLSGSHLQEMYIGPNSSTERVWIDTYSHPLGKVGRETTYGWVSADEAEQIGLALLLAADQARKNRKLRER